MTGICTLTFWGSIAALIFTTVPIGTPWKSTAAPTRKPCRSPGKYMTTRSMLAKNLPDPKTRMPATANTKAPTTKPPMTAGLACLLMDAPFPG